MENAGKAVRWIAGQGEPASGQQKIGAIFSDGRQANAGDGAVLLISQNPAVIKGQLDPLAGRHHIGQRHRYIKSVLTTAVHFEDFARGIAHVAQAQVRVAVPALADPEADSRFPAMARGLAPLVRLARQTSCTPTRFRAADHTPSTFRPMERLPRPPGVLQTIKIQ